jgi:hypothetical protein
VLYLFFIPHSSIFNITYISLNSTEVSKKYNSDDVSKIVLNSRAYNVMIESDEEEETIFVEARANSFGFVLNKHSKFAITTSIKNEVLTINIEEPYGFATKNNSYIKLNIPNGKDFDLVLSNKSAKTTFESSNVSINNFDYSTTRGECELISGTIKGNINLNLNKCKFKIKSSFTTSSNDTSLKLTTGKFIAEHSVLGDIKVVDNKRGVIKINECKDFTKLVPVAGGQININKCNILRVNTSDTDIYVGSAQGVDIKLSKSGGAEIGSLQLPSIVSTDEGNIKINSADSTVSASSNSGNITINNATATISVSSNYGDVIVNFSDSAKSYLDSEPQGVKYRVLYAKIYNAKLTATGVEHVGSIAAEESGIRVSGNGRVNLNMKNVYGTNNIDGKNGSVYVVVNKNSSYILQTSSNAGNVRVNLAQIPEYNGYTQKTARTTNVNCNSSSHSLTVRTNQGDLTVLDTCFA